MLAAVTPKLLALENLVGIHVHRNMHSFRKRQFLEDRTHRATETANRFRPKENLVAVKAVGAFDGGGPAGIHVQFWVGFLAQPAVDSFSGELQKPLMFGANMNQ